MREKISLRGYYEGTLVVLLGWLFLLTWAAQTVSHWVLIPTGAFALYCFRIFWRGVARPKWAPIIVWFLLAAVGAYHYYDDRDILWLFSYSSLGLIPFLLTRRETFTGYWTSVVGIILLALINLLAGDSLAEFLIFIALASTLVFSLNAAHLYFYVGPTEASVRRLPHHYFLPFLGSVALGLCVGGLLFVFFPRALQWQNPLGMRQKASVTGYSGKVSLGDASIVESQSVAMIVEASDPVWLQYQGPFLLMRGSTLDRFDGVRWQATHPDRIPYSSPSDLLFTSSFEKRFLRLRILRERHSSQDIFLTGAVHDAVLPRAVVGALRVDRNGSLSREARGDLRYAYSLSVSPTRRPPMLDKLTRRDYSRKLQRPENLKFSFGRNAEDFSRFLEVPPEIARAAYFRNWVNEVFDGRPPEVAGPIFGRLVNHFKTQFRVGYEAASNGVVSLETFLKDGRYGHCEYFATASVLLLRTLGIPARLALGYRGGTFNALSQVLEIRESNAHAWVEAYVPDVGWLSFDPTPLVVRPITPNWAHRLEAYWTASRYWLQRYLVDYNSQTQAGIFQNIGSGATWRKRGTASSVHQSWVVPLSSLLVLFIGGWLARRTWKGWRRRRGTFLPVYYLEFEARIKAMGWTRAAGETYARFHRRLIASGQFSEVVEEIGAALERDLYSGRPTSKSERRVYSERIRLLGLRS